MNLWLDAVGAVPSGDCLESDDRTPSTRRPFGSIGLWRLGGCRGSADLTGQAAGSSTGGIGFHKGVRFNLSQIIP